MSVSQERERKYYNQRIIKEVFKDEIKKPHKIDWIALITTCFGCFLGLLLNDAIGIETLIHNTVVSFILQVLIVVSAILIVKAAIYAWEKIIGKNNWKK